MVKLMQKEIQRQRQHHQTYNRLANYVPTDQHFADVLNLVTNNANPAAIKQTAMKSVAPANIPAYSKFEMWIPAPEPTRMFSNDAMMASLFLDDQSAIWHEAKAHLCDFSTIPG
ncbi:TPA: hypothetical protein N0F65_005232 [Lagenidium giganteum]|uniref:Uncharacterized protein n=1 Tax=Lagenidium giganteum TaxID=4803 RepID=A0AAV2YKM1_9STRA|nr:TPA: hypothetical protein N0F65_005232 [Lagenidium giganteum]